MQHDFASDAAASDAAAAATSAAPASEMVLLATDWIASCSTMACVVPLCGFCMLALWPLFTLLLTCQWAVQVQELPIPAYGAPYSSQPLRLWAPMVQTGTVVPYPLEIQFKHAC